MKIVICEDERHWSYELNKSVSQWALSRKIDIECSLFSTPQDLIKHLSLNNDMDVVLLDISLGKEVIDGMVAAKHIRKMGNHVPIIFVTVDSFRASDGYLVEAMGFLGKPIDDKRLSLFLDRVLRKKRSERIIKIVSETSAINVLQNDIIYAEVRDHTVIYHTTKKPISLRGSLSDILELLGTEHFFQIHRSYVIAKAKIHKIKSTYPYSVDVINGIDIVNLPVSRNYIDKLLAVYSDDLLERLI